MGQQQLLLLVAGVIIVGLVAIDKIDWPKNAATGKFENDKVVFDIDLRRRSPRTGIVNAPAAQIARPDKIKTAVLHQHSNRAAILVRNGYRAAADNAAVSRDTRELRAVSQENLRPDRRGDWRARRRRRRRIPPRHAAR
jgi:hypothetical protein